MLKVGDIVRTLCGRRGIVEGALPHKVLVKSIDSREIWEKPREMFRKETAIMENTEKKKRGFALMESEKVKAIASVGGKRAHESGNAHKYSREEASKWGSVGGKRSAEVRKELRQKKQETRADDPVRDEDAASTSV